MNRLKEIVGAIICSFLLVGCENTASSPVVMADSNNSPYKNNTIDQEETSTDVSHLMEVIKLPFTPRMACYREGVMGKDKESFAPQDYILEGVIEVNKENLQNLNGFTEREYTVEDFKEDLFYDWFPAEVISAVNKQLEGKHKITLHVYNVKSLTKMPYSNSGTLIYLPNTKFAFVGLS